MDYSYDELLDSGMTPEEMLSEGLVDVLDLPYESLSSDDDDDDFYYSDSMASPFDENGEPVF